VAVVENLYVHFPFCRNKCSYCSLYSRTGVSPSDRDAYVKKVREGLDRLVGLDCLVGLEIGKEGQACFTRLKTVYFGGGSPALCDLSLLNLEPSTFNLQPPFEFTVELHPLDVTEEKLSLLKDLGVNRISMGVQSFDDAVLADMGRGYTVAEAERAFRLVKQHFDNAGIDLIVGYPGDEGEKVKVEGQGQQWREHLSSFCEMGMRHCSVYSLQNERGLKNVPDDDVVLDGIRAVADCLREQGLERYEISNYAVPGYECRHNLAVWRGEDYAGIGEGAYGRIGLTRTVGRKTGVTTSTVTPEEDLKERTLFRLRTREGLDASRFPNWRRALDRFVKEGLLTQHGAIYRLTDRGTEVCDSILAELV